MLKASLFVILQSYVSSGLLNKVKFCFGFNQRLIHGGITGFSAGCWGF
jgi:hypothetical protein